MRHAAQTGAFPRIRHFAVTPVGRLVLAAFLAAGTVTALRAATLAVSAGGLFTAISAALALTALPDSLPRHPRDRDDLTGLAMRRGLIAGLNWWLRRPGRPAQTAVLLAEIDDFRLMEEAHDRITVEGVLRHVADRLRVHLRGDDIAARLDGPVFAIALAPSRRLTLETTLQLATRLQHALAEPFQTRAATIRVSVSIGFAMSDRVETRDGSALVQAATSALGEAQRNGPGAVRSYSEMMRDRAVSRNALVCEVARALHDGQITAYFQPQLRLDTGELAGFETLTRWIHPERGLVSPADFLPALRQAGRMEELGDLMVTHALDALAHWDAEGHAVPRIGVNFSTAELRNPHLVDRIAMMLDARGIAPQRLVIEVLETVVANTAEDVVARNLAGLADLGCGIDLDDFGTGYASITNIRRLSIGRIKIDRSFITRIDSDREQQDMVAAILTMADRLGLETLAEGVESPAERAMLARLGCEYAQGFLFARPMPLAEADAWIAAHGAPAAEPVPLHRKTG